MNSREGGSLFLKSFTESCVKEAIRQETLTKYNDRISRIKRVPDILLDIILTPLKILQELLRIVYSVIAWFSHVIALVFVISVGFSVLIAVFAILWFIAICMYHNLHFETCSLDLNKDSNEFSAHTFKIIVIEVMKPLVNSELVRNLHDYTMTYYRERNTNKKETSQIQSTHGPPGPVGPFGAPGCVGRECAG
jgi:hypothetical protein